MKSNRSTQLLLLLLVLSMACAGVGMSRLSSARDAALARTGELQSVRADLADLARSHAGPMSSAPANSEDPELNRRLRAAAAAAGIAEQLSSIEPGQPTRDRNADYLETPVFVRLNAATLRETVMMLSRLTASDRAMQIKAIELAPPPPAQDSSATNAPTTAPAERWTADLTVSYLIYSPRHQP